MPYNAYVPYQIDPESLRGGHRPSFRKVAVNLAYAASVAGAAGVKRKFFEIAMSQGDNVAVAGLSVLSSVGAGEASKIARTVARDVGGVPVVSEPISPGAASLIRSRTRHMFKRGGRRLSIRRPRFKRRAPVRRYRIRRNQRRNSRYSRRRYY